MDKAAECRKAGTFGDYQLRILATSDLHAHVMPYDYTWDQPLHSAGLARTASLIRTARGEVRNSLLVDNGDFLQGNPLGELIATEGRPAAEKCHPVIAAMNAVGYDAASLGNHEFSYGIAFLQDAMAGASFPFVCANAVRFKGPSALDDRPFCPPAALLERRLAGADGSLADLCVGVIGFLPPHVETWESKHLAGHIATRDILEAAEAWVPHLRVRGADIVLALCHSGIGEPEPHEKMENAAIPLARIAGIDALVAGHTHIAFPDADAGTWPHVDSLKGSIHGKPAVMAGFWGSHLGVIDLALRLGPLGWSVAGFAVSTRAISRRAAKGRLQALVGSDKAVADSIRASHRATLAHIRKPVGTSDIPIHSYFARLADSAALQLVQDAQRHWLSEAVRGTADAGLPILSSASPFKSGGRGGPQYFTDIAPGDIALKHVADLYVFPNSIRAVRITGARLRDWLERSAAQFHQLRPGIADQPLIDPEAPSYNFDAIDGITYEIDLSQPSRYGPHGALLRPQAVRIRNLCHDGKPVDPQAGFLVATNNFRASGGGTFPGLDGQSTILEPLTPNSDVIRDYIAREGRIAPRASHNWRLAPLPRGTAAWFDTGPRARQHLNEDIGLTIEALADTAEGFLRCRVRF